jgi:hypothetical protein
VLEAELELEMAADSGGEGLVLELGLVVEIKGWFWNLEQVLEMEWLYCRLLWEVRSWCWSWGNIGRERWCLSFGLEREIGTVFEFGVVSETGR